MPYPLPHPMPHLLHAAVRTLALAAALAGFTVPSARAEDIPGTDFTSGNWSGRAWANDDGSFSDCYFGVNYVDGEVLSVALMADDTLTVYLSAPGVTFQPGRSYDAALMTEVGYPITGTAIAPNEGYIGFTIAEVDAAIDYLTQGSYLRLYGIGIDQSFDTRGMGGALALARACLMDQTATAAAPVAVKEPAKPAAPPLGRSGDGSKPAQMSGIAAPFKRVTQP